MKRIRWTMVVFTLALCLGWSPSIVMADEEGTVLVFSTEEEFITHGKEPADGNPIISDGDLLGWKLPSGPAYVIARNRELLAKFGVDVDLGLDAACVIDAREGLIAFSTELDDPRGRFTAGDLLTTSGAIIPNTILLSQFKLRVPRDLGLDAIHLVGDPGAIVKLLSAYQAKDLDHWRESPGELAKLFASQDIDVWFSTEGTGEIGRQSLFLDGDLLSAATGTIVVPNSSLLPASVPAGIPARGVDFGLDAVTGDRKGNPRTVLHSTEILFPARPTFTDGDVLKGGGGVAYPHHTLIADFAPKSKFLGLDALHFVVPEPPRDPHIQKIGERSVIDIDGGRVALGMPGTGLFRANAGTSPPGDEPRRPFGAYVPIAGYLPDAGIRRFRVAYRNYSDPVPAVNTAPGIRTTWNLESLTWIGFGWACEHVPGDVLETDSSGWMDAAIYLSVRNGSYSICPSPDLRLAVWKTSSLPDPDGHYVVWLEWEDLGGVLHREPREHHVQLDNTRPRIAPYPDGLQMKVGSATLAACSTVQRGQSKIEVWGQFADAYYWDYRLRVRGGLPPASAGYGPHSYDDPHDGTPGVKNTNPTGTTPAGTTVYLRTIDMHDLGASFQECCYVLDLWVRDAAILHRFNHRTTWPVGPHEDNAFITFAAGP